MSKPAGAPVTNRGEAIPTIILNSGNDIPASGHPRQKTRDVLENVIKAGGKDQLENGGESREDITMQDRMLNTLLRRIIPSDETPSDTPSASSARVERPNFSLPTMSNNFRRFNARIGVAFVFQARLIRLLSWRKPTQTMAFLAVYSFLCLNPYLLTVAPLAGTLFFIMVPAFLARHPPPTSAYDPVGEKEIELYAYPLQGPPVAPARKLRPAPDLSKDFFRNMRDLQNSMEDFSQLHDAIVKTVNPLTNFSNEAMSSALFIALAAGSCPLLLFAHLLPLRAIFLVGGWGAICSGHPAIARAMRKAEAEGKPPKGDKKAENILQHFIAADIVVSSSPERREVEIFELQQRVAPSSSYWSLPAEDLQESDYESVMFSSNPYTPLDPTRVSGARPKGTRFFEDVLPPRGWKWAESKWRLDLAAQEWVGERCVSGVEVEMEGERWVWDIEYNHTTTEDDGIADTYEEWAARGGSLKGKNKGQAKSKEKLPSWEEGTAGMGKKGEWRRRRWARLVERKILDESKERSY